MLKIKQSNREEFKIISHNMIVFSALSVEPFGERDFLLLEGKDNYIIAATESGSAIPEEINLHFGNTLRLWNLRIIRGGDVQHHLKSTLIHLTNYALANKYDSIVIEILFDARPAAIQTGFIVRESSESDKLYATKRLF